ncbi:Stearoyl-CoA 9-desaturase electron transfer partner [Streptomyces sp. YIM 130001]|uniref:hybrid-cluster NAD(P)-dependent oxidoreductase n=1 Tax=Streptomyces sp. YIM 130001 TaxID=2259644 RepID=UPI000EE57515|nr:hybrid-cluster NAD(P)-dependent oxidoreductase [Streptomyces sp. YIM 130001]RII20429.1 Stearoyl-CoA 9-desaturase electron transfer partner [Streptomyces sp. YIM 130001]
MTTAAMATGSLPPVWADGLLVCKQVHDTTHDVRTFVLEPTDPHLFRHDPGQFLTLLLDIDGRQVERCYTISSPPTRPDLLTITVKRVPGGRVSNWLHDHLTPGSQVWARGPLGRFTIARHPAPKYLFLSAGSGVTPLMSMTRALYDLAHAVDVVFVHSARSFDDIIFRQELEFIALTSPHIRVTHVLDDRGEQLCAELLRELAPDFPEREVFTCGPGGYMQAVQGMLSGAGFAMEHYHEESFTFESADRDVADQGTGQASFKVEFARTGRTIDCDAGTTVLAAASREGITLPASCAQGMCGTCKTTLLSGSVDMRHNGGIRPREIAANKILLCSSRPLDHLVIDG